MEEDKKPRLVASSLAPVAGGGGGGSSSSAAVAAGASSSSSSSSVAAAARRGAAVPAVAPVGRRRRAEVPGGEVRRRPQRGWAVQPEAQGVPDALQGARRPRRWPPPALLPAMQPVRPCSYPKLLPPATPPHPQKIKNKKVKYLFSKIKNRFVLMVDHGWLSGSKQHI